MMTKTKTKTIFGLALVFALAQLSCTRNQDNEHGPYPINALDIRQLSLTDEFWMAKIRTIQDSTIAYSFQKCEEEGRMDNFLIAGGVMEGSTRGHMPFDDTDLYKLIEGASNTLISSPDPELESYLDSIIEIIRIGQESDGYITSWFTIDRKAPPAWWVAPSEKRWENEISSHELYNSGHLFEAAAVHYLATGKRNFLDIALRNADLLVEHFGPGKLQTPPGHQVVETGLIKLYAITGKDSYLVLAKDFLEFRGDSTTHKLFGPYSQDHLPVIEQGEAVGHAVRAVYMYAAMTDVAIFFDDLDYLEAVNSLWENVVHKKMYLTGGIGSRHDGEAFGEDYELPNATAYGETCAAIGNIYWNHRLFLMSGDSRYYDVIERSLYNGMISGISQSGKEFFYPNPLESDGEYKFNHGVSCTRSPWFDCSCCPTNLVRFIPSVPGLIYAHSADTVYVNLFASGKGTFNIGGRELSIIQENNYPWEGKLSLQVDTRKRKDLVLKIRIPGWSRNQVLPGDLYSYFDHAKSSVLLKINGQHVPIEMEKGYAVIHREWVQGDRVELELPMPVRKVRTNPLVEENRHMLAIERGPIVYCAEEVDNPEWKPVLAPEESFSVREGYILDEKAMLIENGDHDNTLTLVPYYLWSNRGEGRMKVWFPQSKIITN